MAQKLVSVIMPAYNCAEVIGRSIESVQTQTYETWELIVVDDASTDDTIAVVETYALSDKRIRLYRLAENSGAAVARNYAMDKADGSYMAFLDSDDCWKKEKLEHQLAWMQQNGYAISCTAHEMIDMDDKPVGKIYYSPEKIDYDRLLLDCPVGNSSVMYDVEKLGKFQVPNIRKRNDYALWLKMLKVEPYIWGMPELLMQRRLRPHSVSSNKLQLIKYHWMVYRDIEHLGFWRSVFHVAYWCFIKVFHLK